MKINREKYQGPERKTHGSGKVETDKFKSIGAGVVIEPGVWVFHPENIELGDNVYVGHGTFLKGYYNNMLTVGKDSWIGQGCFIHAGGGVEIGEAVGVGPCVKILSHQHVEEELEKPVLFCGSEYKKVTVCDGADIGMGSVILPGVTIGEGAIVGAGSVVTKDVAPFTVVAGNPARLLRERDQDTSHRTQDTK